MHLRPILFLASFSLAAGCGGSGQVPMSDGGGGDDAAVMPMPDLVMAPPADMALPPIPALPQVTRHTGRIIANMSLVTIAWSNSSYAKLADDFGNMVFSSQWLKAVGGEYGVKGGTHIKHVVMNTPAPAKMTDAQFLQWLKDRVNDQTLPAPTPETLYMAFFPDQDKITFGSDQDGYLCEDFTGYHWFDSLNNKNFTYAVIGDCKLGPEDVGNTASHELIEVATDPYDAPNDGWYLDPDPNDPWIVEVYSEVADLCVEQPSVMEGGIPLAPSWSNAEAAKGHDPCVPGAKATYESVLIVDPPGVPELSPGETITYTIAGWSTNPAQAPWEVKLIDADYADFAVTVQKGMLDATMLKHGQFATVTLTAPKTAKRGQTGGGLIMSGPDRHLWPVAYSIK